MDSILLILLIVVDIALLGVVYFLGKQRINPVEIIKEVDEERRRLTELHTTIRDEMKLAQQKSRDLYEKISALANDIEMETKSGGKNLAEEVEQLFGEFSKKIEHPIKQITKKQASMENLLKKASKEKEVLVKILSRGEELIKFFNKNIPYEEVLQEIEDKKYADARHLLSQGLEPDRVAKELNLPESEVSLLAAIG